MSKPITPRQHGLIDWVFLGANLVLPTAIGASGKARGLFAAFGAIQGGLNAVTSPYGVSKAVPFSVHGAIEKNSLPIYLIAPLALGLGREPKARAYWIALGVALVTVYNLTDWNAKLPRLRR